MATLRGCWLRDQTSARFGACNAAVVEGASVPLVGTRAVDVVGAPEPDSTNWRAVAVNVRLEIWRGRACAATRSRETFIVIVVVWERWSGELSARSRREAVNGPCLTQVQTGLAPGTNRLIFGCTQLPHSVSPSKLHVRWWGWPVQHFQDLGLSWLY